MDGTTNAVSLGDDSVKWNDLAENVKSHPRLFISSDAGFDDWAALNGRLIILTNAVSTVNFDANDFAALPGDFEVIIVKNGGTWTFKWTSSTYDGVSSKKRSDSGSVSCSLMTVYHIRKIDSVSLFIYS